MAASTPRSSFDSMYEQLLRRRARLGKKRKAPAAAAVAGRARGAATTPPCEHAEAAAREAAGHFASGNTPASAHVEAEMILDRQSSPSAQWGHDVVATLPRGQHAGTSESEHDCTRPSMHEAEDGARKRKGRLPTLPKGVIGSFLDRLESTVLPELSARQWRTSEGLDLEPDWNSGDDDWKPHEGCS
eukprot:SM000321S12196  [mRNA]  locus=s321:99018:99771:+ [translate_table: standard]